MPTPLRRSALLAAVVLSLAACSQEKRDSEPRMPADEPEAAEHPTGISAAEGYRAQGTPKQPADLPVKPPPPAPTAFACEGGRKVEMGYLVAVVTTTDGRKVQISRDPDDAAHFGDDALALRTRGAEAELSEGPGRTFHCTGE